MNVRPEFWMFAGPNGAGKSTLATHLGRECLNPDKLTVAYRHRLRRFGVVRPSSLVGPFANWLAVREVMRRVRQAVTTKESVAFETVLASPKYFPIVRAARANGFYIVMVYIALASVDVHIERVDLRVKEGGHSVPIDKIRKRWAVSTNNLFEMLPLLDELTVYDNTNIPPQLVATVVRGQVAILQPQRLPHITSRLAQWQPPS